MRYFVIVNPVSGRGLGEKSVPVIETYLHFHHIIHTLVRTERPMHARELAAQATREGYDVIVCASGDGTINEAINGMMRAFKEGFHCPALAILPIGTGNDLVEGMGIQARLEERLNALTENKRRKLDIGYIETKGIPEGRYFANGVGIGFDAATGIKAAEVRWTRGMLAYLVGVVETIFLYYIPPKLEIVLDDEKITQFSLMVSVMNGKRMGGGFRMAPKSKPDDGVFDLCIAETASKARMFGLIPYFMRGTQEGQPEIKMRRSQKVQITALEGTFPFHADGELLGDDETMARIEILPGALEIISN